MTWSCLPLAVVVVCIVIIFGVGPLARTKLRNRPHEFVRKEVPKVREELIDRDDYRVEVIDQAIARLDDAAGAARVTAGFYPASYTGLSHDSPEEYYLHLALFWSPIMSPTDRLRHELVHHCDAIHRDNFYRERYNGCDLMTARRKGLVSPAELAEIENIVLERSDPQRSWKGFVCRVIRGPKVWLAYKHPLEFAIGGPALVAAAGLLYLW